MLILWISKMFSSALLVFSLVQLCPALPVSQKHLLSCCDSADPVDNCLYTTQSSEAEAEMSTGNLVPTHFPARRAAQVALHYINTRHGSPFKVFGLQQVHEARAQEVAGGGRKYYLDFSVVDWASEGSAAFRCSAEVFFPRRDEAAPPEVQCSCEALQHINCTAEETAFYRKYSEAEHAVTAHNIPGNYGNMTEEMKPFWHLARVASSFIMLRESTENTEFNMAQVASVAQQANLEEQLMLKYHVLLHDMPSQEIIHWKLSMSWSPNEGVRVMETELQPKCPHAMPPKSTEPVSSSSALN
ncbi:latexin isoform X2 [Triplophysa dalaica]|uniref:latexin isoform X2 n=1 Tax=Triplophysa dalaica TaxID=1582913 RepID=UPI0024DFE135|nr:latexin isoform X2 [Triplophysa dalaica]